MKRESGDHYERIMTLENIEAAWAQYNSHRPEDLRKEYNEARARRILEKMQTDFPGVIGTPRRRPLFEAGKWRELEIPSFEAIIAMLAVWNVCGAAIERRIHLQSFSSRKGMGGHLAAKKCERFMHREKDGDAKYCWYFDIKKFYRHIDKRVMMHRIEAVYKDPRIIELFRAVVYSTPTGLPIGYPFSHALANLYLVPLYFLVMSVKGIAKTFVYMDNWNVFSRFKKPLRRAMGLARRWLAGVGCAMKADWQIYPTAARAVRICGFEIGADKPTRLYRGIWRRILRNVALYRLKPTTARYLSLMSRLGWLKAIHQEYKPIFMINGGYLWKRK